MQQVTPGIGDAYISVEDALRGNFLPALFQVTGEGTPGICVTRLPVKQAGLALPDPTNTAPVNWTASCVITGYLVVLLRVQEEFWTADHSACLKDGRMAVRNRSFLLAEEALAETLAGGPVQGAR